MTRFVGAMVLVAAAVTALMGCAAVIPSGPAGQPTPTRFRPPVVTSRPITPGPPATPTPTATPSGQPTPRPGATATARPSTKGACGDPAYSLAEFKWEGPWKWYFQVESTPEQYDPDEVLEVLERSVNNIVTAHNDCGLPDNVDIEAIYKGPTTEIPCGDSGRFGLNVIGFRDIPPDEDPRAIAFTCPYLNRDREYVEADIGIRQDVDWALSLDECEGFQELLEAIMTHEVGHVFGLGHVNERRHGDLTMSTDSNGPCADDEITLGLGDILGLEELHGTP